MGSDDVFFRNIGRRCCLYCYVPYDKYKEPPKALKCGHSICQACLQEKIEGENNRPTCTRCGAVIPKVPIENFTNNLALYNFCKSLTEEENSDFEERDCFDNLFTGLRAQVNSIFLEDKKFQCTPARNKMIEERTQILRDWAHNIEDFEAKLRECRTVGDIREILMVSANKINECQVKWSRIPDYTENYIKLTYEEFKDFEMTSEVINTLRTTKSYYGVIYDDFILYGLIEVTDNTIFLHSACLRHLDHNKTPIYKYFTIKKFMQVPAHTFIDFKGSSDPIRIIIKHEKPNDLLVRQFMLLCSGERMKTYRHIKATIIPEILFHVEFYLGKKGIDSKDLFTGIPDVSDTRMKAKMGLIEGIREDFKGATFKMYLRSEFNQTVHFVIGEAETDVRPLAALEYAVISDCGLCINIQTDLCQF